MGIFSRLTDIVNSNINAMLDRAEDPEKIVRLIIQEMEDTLVETRTAAARAIADKKQLMRKSADLAGATTDWEHKAELAVARERDDLARGALLARDRAREAAEQVEREIKAIDDRLAKIDADMAKLQAKLTEAKNKQKGYELRHKTARDQIRMRSHIHDRRLDDALARYEELERRLDQIEGRAESYDLGRPRSLEQEFVELETEGRVNEELAALKARLGRDRQA